MLQLGERGQLGNRGFDRAAHDLARRGHAEFDRAGRRHEAIRRRVEAAARGEFASDEEVAALLAKHGAKHGA